MFSRFPQIFDLPSPRFRRNYEIKPRISHHPNLVKSLKAKKSKRQPSIFQGILQFFTTPIQNWALQYQKIFFTFALHQWIYNEIVSFSTFYNKKKSTAMKQNLMLQQLNQEIGFQNSFSFSCQKKPQISLHNIFVLMTQYKVMQQIIFDLNTRELEMMIDGLSFIYFHGVGKLENIGQALSQQQITMGIGGWGTIDELTCCIHFITTHTKLYKILSQKQCYSLMKEIQILKMPYFIKLYDYLQKNKKIDNIVNSIPMFMQFLQFFVKHKNNSLAGCQFVTNVKWLTSLGQRIMSIIHYNINKLLLINNQLTEQLSAEDLQIISELESFNEQNQKEESQIVFKLTQKGMLLKQTEGQINTRVLFSYAFHHLYTVNFLVKLNRKVLQLSRSRYNVYKSTCQKVSKFLLRLFECAFKFDFTLPESSVQQICEIIKIISYEGHYLVKFQEKEIKGYDFLYGKEINSEKVKQFAKNLQKSQRFGCYFNKRPRPLLSSSSQMIGQQIADNYNVALEHDEESIFFYLLSSIFTMKSDYLSIVYSVLKHADHRELQKLQFYLIKSELLHFLIQEEHQVNLKQKKNIQLLYNTLGYLIKGNLVAYAIVDQLISFETDAKTQRSQFLQDLKKNFSQTKQLLMIMLSDSITVNQKSPYFFFCPLVLRGLLYSSSQNLTLKNCQSKHQVWISYIFNVILHELFTQQKKIAQIEGKKNKIQINHYQNLVQNILLVVDPSPKNNLDNEIFDWITFILFVHIDFTLTRKNPSENDQDIVLAKFIMTYLTTILSEAIKWKQKDQSERIIEFMNSLQQWENHFTDLILAQQNNQDILQKRYGGVIKFLYLKRWNKKIIRTIKLYLQSIEDYNISQKMKKKTLQRVKSLKIIRQ